MAEVTAQILSSTKDKGGFWGEGQLHEVARQFPEIRPSPLPPGAERETPPQMETSFTNANVSHQRASKFHSSEPPSHLQFLKVTSLK